MADLELWGVHTMVEASWATVSFVWSYIEGQMFGHSELLKCRKGTAAGHITVSYVGLRTKCPRELGITLMP